MGVSIFVVFILDLKFYSSELVDVFNAMKLFVYESEKVYDLEGDVRVSEDPFAGYVIYGCYGTIILPKWFPLRDDSLNHYCDLLKSLRIKATKGIDFTMFGHIDLRDYIGPGGPSFTLSSFSEFLGFLSRLSPDVDRKLDVDRKYGLFIHGSNFVAGRNMVWQLYKSFGLLRSFFPLRGVAIDDEPERKGLRVKLDDFPFIRIFIKLPVPLLTKHQIIRSHEYEFLWEVDLKEMINFYRSRLSSLFFSESDPNYPERIRAEALHALAFYLSPYSLSPLTDIIVTIWQQHYDKVSELVKQYQEKLNELCKSYEVIYISDPEKPLEAILNNSERELIEKLVAKGLKYRGKAVVD